MPYCELGESFRRNPVWCAAAAAMKAASWPPKINRAPISMKHGVVASL